MLSPLLDADTSSDIDIIEPIPIISTDKSWRSHTLTYNDDGNRTTTSHHQPHLIIYTSTPPYQLLSSPNVRMDVEPSPCNEMDETEMESNSDEMNIPMLQHPLLTARITSTKSTRTWLLTLPIDIMTSISDFITLPELVAILSTSRTSQRQYHVNDIWQHRCRYEYRWRVENEEQVHLMISKHVDDKHCHWLRFYQYQRESFLQPVTSLIHHEYEWKSIFTHHPHQYAETMMKPDDTTLFILSNGPQHMRRSYLSKQDISMKQMIFTCMIQELPFTCILFLIAATLHIVFPNWITISDYIYLDTSLFTSTSTLSWLLPFVLFFITCDMICSTCIPVSRIEGHRWRWYMIQHMTSVGINQVTFSYTLVVLVMVWFWLFNIFIEWMGALACILSLCYSLYSIFRQYRMGNIHPLRSIILITLHLGILCMLYFIDIIMLFTQYILSPLFHITAAWQHHDIMTRDWSNHGIMASTLFILWIVYVLDSRLQHSMLLNPAVRSTSLRAAIIAVIQQRFPLPAEQDEEEHVDVEVQEPVVEQPQQQPQPETASATAPGHRFLDTGMGVEPNIEVVAQQPEAAPATPEPAPAPSRPGRPIGIASLGAHLEEIGGMLFDALFTSTTSTWCTRMMMIRDICMYTLMTSIMLHHGFYTCLIITLCVSLISSITPLITDAMIFYTQPTRCYPQLLPLQQYRTDKRPFIPLSEQ